MRRAYFNAWFTGARVLLLGVLTAVIFFWRPWNDLAPMSAGQILVAVVAVAAGIKLGFTLATSATFRASVLRIAPEHYTLAGAVGFVLGALWVAEGNSAWPLVVWFLPAAVLDGIASATSLMRMQSAS
ncbi:MAG: hypothetical protein L0Z53_16005 [Acidobacteriales bacterium]|nr:hypothetical protein [Terriglobales bacterium]